MGVVITLPPGRPLTLAAFEGLRDVDDGHRYELVDGSLVVTPGPSWAHQAVLSALMRELLLANPDEGRYVLIPAPHDAHLPGPTVLQPDLSIYDLQGPGRTRPVQTIEVLSPSTRHIDVGLKRSRYATAGVEHYWVVDPDPSAVEVTAWQLQDGEYPDGFRARGPKPVTLPGVWPVTLRPATRTRHV